MASLTTGIHTYKSQIYINILSNLDIIFLNKTFWSRQMKYQISWTVYILATITQNKPKMKRFFT